MEHRSVCLYLKKILKYPTHNIAKVIHLLRNYKPRKLESKAKVEKKNLLFNVSYLV